MQQHVHINPPGEELAEESTALFTDGALSFLVDLLREFEARVDQLYEDRLKRKCEFLGSEKLPRFEGSNIRTGTWSVAPVAEGLRDWRLVLGDVSPANGEHFSKAFAAPVSAVQVDFDDGHCPTWRNQIVGLYNVFRATRGLLPGFPRVPDVVMMLRPRAWNMVERNVSVDGRQVPGALLDFSLLFYHNARLLESRKRGPCFYLSKLESSSEAKLWNDIFSWSERTLSLPQGSTKACVLIENILAVFQAEEILYELRERSLGLNCGIWDYCASIIGKFGDRPRFLIPDRTTYVHAGQRFLRSYMELVTDVCHRRGTFATGGMLSNVLQDTMDPDLKAELIKNAQKAKLAELDIGLDGFLVYDPALVPHLRKLWNLHRQESLKIPSVVSEEDLLDIPRGDATEAGLRRNILVTILFVFNWLRGRGHFILEGRVEDSATAEISRCQVWQWIRHRASMRGSGIIVSRALVEHLAEDVLRELRADRGSGHWGELGIAHAVFLDLVNRRENPEFLTSFLYDELPSPKHASRL